MSAVDVALGRVVGEIALESDHRHDERNQLDLFVDPSGSRLIVIDQSGGNDTETTLWVVDAQQMTLRDRIPLGAGSLTTPAVPANGAQRGGSSFRRESARGLFAPEGEYWLGWLSRHDWRGRRYGTTEVVRVDVLSGRVAGRLTIQGVGDWYRPASRSTLLGLLTDALGSPARVVVVDVTGPPTLVATIPVELELGMRDSTWEGAASTDGQYFYLLEVRRPRSVVALEGGTFRCNPMGFRRIALSRALWQADSWALAENKVPPTLGDLRVLTASGQPAPAGIRELFEIQPGDPLGPRAMLRHVLAPIDVLYSSGDYEDIELEGEGKGQVVHLTVHLRRGPRPGTGILHVVGVEEGRVVARHELSTSLASIDGGYGLSGRTFFPRIERPVLFATTPSSIYDLGVTFRSSLAGLWHELVGDPGQAPAPVPWAPDPGGSVLHLEGASLRSSPLGFSPAFVAESRGSDRLFVVGNEGIASGTLDGPDGFGGVPFSGLWLGESEKWEEPVLSPRRPAVTDDESMAVITSPDSSRLVVARLAPQDVRDQVAGDPETGYDRPGLGAGRIAAFALFGLLLPNGWSLLDPPEATYPAQALSGAVRYIALSTGGRTGYVVDEKKNEVHRFDLETGEVSKPIASGRYLLPSPGGRSIAILPWMASDDVGLVNSASNELIASVSAGDDRSVDLVWTPDGSYAIVASRRRLQVLDARSGAILGKVDGLRLERSPPIALVETRP